ncbi:MAG: sigma-70 family RNA polymerase sigma factor [Erysipelotrichaceae bacterium]|nr:sigma-70 family RNA polymerase sigma factor [Erysipelotrichaceae bacterium]
MNPYELLYMSRTGDTYAIRALFNLYKPILIHEVKNAIDACPCLNIYWDDLMQEGMLALYKAADTYREDRGSSFATFLTIVIKNTMITYTRTVKRKQLGRVNHMYSLDSMISENNPAIETLEQKNRLSDPEYVLRMNQARDRLMEQISKLNPREQQVLLSWMNGNSYSSSAQEMGITAKQFDGRKQRVRKKIKKSILEKA